MKTTKICYVLCALFLTACHKDDGPTSPDFQKSSAKQITGFVFKAADNETLVYDIFATIDQNGKTITANVPNGTDVTAILPEISVSEKAVVGPAGAANFTNPVGYTVTAEDGTTTVYSASVSIAPSSEKQILSFRFEGIQSEGVTVDISAEIDKENKSITATMPSGTDITALEPTVEISAGARLEPEGPQDFTEPINYTVTAEDGTSSTYLVTVKVALTEKEVLLLIAKENPGNTLESWTMESSLKDFEGVTTDNNGKVIRLFLVRKSFSKLPPEIGQLNNLQKLYLSSNDLESIPSEIGQLLNLQGLFLSDTNLSAIPPEIGQLVNLMELDLSQIGLTSIPSEIGQLANLTTLYLSDNQLDTIPPEIGQLANLEYLLVNDNSLGAIPPEIGQLVNLKALRFNSNELKAIPPEIGQLANLTTLYLSDNQLGTIPPEIGQLINLKELWLFENRLKAIPSETGQLLNLKKLRISNNSLEAVPLEIGQMTGLEALDLAGNDLTKIPNEVCKLDTSNGGNTEVDIVPGVLCEFIL